MSPDTDGSIPLVAAERLAEQIGELARRLMAFFDEQIAELDLTVPQAMLLRSLDGPLPMNQVANRLHCDASNVTGIVDRLEARGLVERRVKPDDRRIKEIVLTSEGEAVRRRAVAVTSKVPGLSTLSESEQSALGALLDRALAHGAPVADVSSPVTGGASLH